MQAYERPKVFEVDHILDIMTYVGCSVSLVFLLFTISALIYIRQVKHFFAFNSLVTASRISSSKYLIFGYIFTFTLIETYSFFKTIFLCLQNGKIGVL